MPGELLPICTQLVRVGGESELSEDSTLILLNEARLRQLCLVEDCKVSKILESHSVLD
jgi:hypothetical protein